MDCENKNEIIFFFIDFGKCIGINSLHSIKSKMLLLKKSFLKF